MSLFNRFDFTFLTRNEAWDDYDLTGKKLDIIKKYGGGCAITDFSILLGGEVHKNYYTNEGWSNEHRCGCWWTKSPSGRVANGMYTIDFDGSERYYNTFYRSDVGARPAISYSSIFNKCSNKTKNKFGILEVEFGEYPQTVVSKDFTETLEWEYYRGIIKETGKKYTTDSFRSAAVQTPFKERTHVEYEYNGKKYIRFVADLYAHGKVLSDGRECQNRDVCWIEVEPIKWLIDEKTNIALSKKILFSGVRFHFGEKYDNDNDFSTTNIKKFMDKYFSKDIIPSRIKEKNINENKDDINVPYNDSLKFSVVNSFESLINKINEISYNLPIEFKNKIDSRISEIIKEYKEMLNDNNIDVNSPRKVLESNLNELLLDITKYKELYDLSLEINESLSLISDDNIEEIKEKNKIGETVEEPSNTLNVKNILSKMAIILSKLDESNINKFKNQIQELLSKPIDEYMKLTNKELNDEFELMHTITKSSFVTELSNILSEMQIFYTKNEKFYSFYNSLISEKTCDKLTSGIDNFIETIRGVIKEIYYDVPVNLRISEMEDVNNKFNVICQRYKIILDSMFKENDLSEDTFTKLENSFREEIHSILIKLNKCAIKHENSKDVKVELNKASGILNGDKLEDNQKESSIALYVEKICDELNKSKLNDDEKELVKKEVEESIASLTIHLNSLDTKEEIIDFKTTINTVFHRLFNDTCKKIYDLEKLREHKKIDNDILDMLERKTSETESLNYTGLNLSNADKRIPAKPKNKKSLDYTKLDFSNINFAGSKGVVINPKMIKNEDLIDKRK